MEPTLRDVLRKLDEILTILQPVDSCPGCGEPEFRCTCDSGDPTLPNHELRFD